MKTRANVKPCRKDGIKEYPHRFWQVCVYRLSRP